MARFYGVIEGNRGAASRMGTPSSGFWAHIRGWNIGIRVELSTDGDYDVCRVYKTHGSNGAGSDELIGTYTNKPEQS